ncbi:YihY/virulence factor BrkB family protein [uncultured Modestobacter sp.]|uniref:YihY/virulence factor BrkB family protein n=1 Tax=uncultured Modestobacter sp. TaxID=380048 RepID=UPI002625B226|nr:YihY/virulence factor BrkB family protein [uncultured Modestobacter sp.]
MSRTERRPSVRRALADARQRYVRTRDQLPGPVLRFGRWVRGPEFFTVAASLAFYAMISIPPMVLIAFWIAGAFVDESTLQGLSDQVDGQTPDQLPVGDVLRELVDIAGQAGPLAVVTAAWPATAYGAALARAFTQVAPESERQIRGWRGRLLALVLIAVLPLVVFSALAALYVVPRFFGSGWAFTALLGLGTFVLLTLVIALVYALFQLRDTRWHDVALGALIAAGLVAVTTGGYLVYLRFFADFSDRYGTSSLATAVLLGLWLLLGNAVLLVGYRLMLRRAIRRQGKDPDASAAATPQVGGPR